jgi:oligopeptidase A
MTAINPLLATQGLPPFSQIRPEHIEAAVTEILQRNRADIAAVLSSDAPPTWDSVIQPLNEINDRLNRLWSPIANLHAVADSEGFRSAYNACLPLLSSYYSENGQNQRMFAAYKTLSESSEFSQLEPAQQQIIKNELRDFHLSGIDLPPAEQQRYQEIQQALSKLSAKFSENLLDATHAWKKHITDENLLSGLPDSAQSLLRQNAEQEQLEGWLVGLDIPSYNAIMMYANNRELRHEVYVAYVTRASELFSLGTQWDNSSVMQETLALRYELAQLLGFKNYAEYSLATKMANSPQQVLDFLLDLSARARIMGLKDLAELKAFANTEHQLADLKMWDIPYYSEKLKQHCYSISQEELRPYFPFEKVLLGLFEVVNRLYGITILERKDIDAWHSDVRFFEVFDAKGEICGQFYLDVFTRRGKRSGAWMGECRVRKLADSKLQLPVAYINCNFTPPVGDTPSLLTHNELITLFHEFGHGLHHMLTRVNYAPVSGINGVLWDAVELPSQFMENWAWEREALDLFSGHYQTGETLPEDLFNKLIAAKNFQAGLFMLRQLEFAVFDFRLHFEYAPNIDIQHLLDEVRQQVAVLIPPSFNRFQHSFGHIFAGGYAAGYYSYKWAEVLSADAFSKFEEQGIFDRATGLQFLHSILEKGGSAHPMQLFVAFRGREPKIDALLRHSGMAANPLKGT